MDQEQEPDLPQVRDNRRRQRYPVGVRNVQCKQRADQIPLPLPVQDDLSPPRDLDRLNHLLERNRRREVADLSILERNRCPLRPGSPFLQLGSPHSNR